MSPGYSDGAYVAAALILGLIGLVVAAAFYVVSSWFLMKIFDKAGVQGKWRAWVPVYNVLVFAKLGDLSPWVMLGALLVSGLLGQIPLIGWILSLVSIAALVMAGFRVGRKLQKDWPYLLLWLIPGIGTLIWYGILAFDGSRWNPAIGPAPWANSFLKDTTVWNGIPVQPAAPVGPGAPGAYPQQAPGAYPPPPAGYQPPSPQGYQPPAPQGYAPPPAAATPPPAAAPPVTPPAAAPAEPPAAPAAPVEPPTAPPAPSADYQAPPATPPAADDAPAIDFGEPKPDDKS